LLKYKPLQSRIESSSHVTIIGLGAFIMLFISLICFAGTFMVSE